ncbi:MAG TPA: transketolase family protein [candidate division WWE3 bacterium]|uniref:Transketolase family protein n=1 Tax=candidate division WWE3 bacterium TaxID=2053526 RepID=A0A7V5J012_UNCKA|nr:transketolase family protein [candidate division WWE3 bacterium]
MKSLKRSTRDAFGKAILALGKKYSNVYVLTADLRDSLRVSDFADALPNQFIECGVAEQNMVGISAGLALRGKVPFATSFGVFSPGRTWDQLRVSVCLSNLNVNIIGGHGGLSNYKDGASHQALEDIAITRVLPNLKVVVPCDYNQTIKTVLSAYTDKSPWYIRLSATKTSDITLETQKFEIGKAQLLREGTSLTIASYGPLLENILNVAKKFGNKVEVLNFHTLKPLDEESLLQSVLKTRRILVIEEHQIIGGLGSAVASALGQKFTKKFKLKILGVPDTFSHSARSLEALYQKFGFDEDSLYHSIKSFLEK